MRFSEVENFGKICVLKNPFKIYICFYCLQRRTKKRNRVCLDGAAALPNHGLAKILAQLLAACNLPTRWRKIELAKQHRSEQAKLLASNQIRAHPLVNDQFFGLVAECIDPSTLIQWGAPIRRCRRPFALLAPAAPRAGPAHEQAAAAKLLVKTLVVSGIRTHAAASCTRFANHYSHPIILTTGTACYLSTITAALV